jgi:hypothetical protein
MLLHHVFQVRRSSIANKIGPLRFAVMLHYLLLGVVLAVFAFWE